MTEKPRLSLSAIDVGDVADALDDNSWDHKAFPGGFLNFVGSNSPDSVKSTPAPVVAVEEPDDSNTNVNENQEQN